MITETYKDLGAIVTYESSDTWTDFMCYEIGGYASDDNHKTFNIPIFEKKGAQSSEDSTTDLKEAQTLIRGVVKWDGCSHYTFGDESGYIHLCGKKNIRDISEIIKKIYNRSGELMSGRDDSEFPLK